MGRPARKLEANETVESRTINAVKYAFGSPEVRLHKNEPRHFVADIVVGTHRLEISLGMLEGAEVWLTMPISLHSEPISALDDEDA